MKQQKTIVIIGGGYAGINAIDALKKEKLNNEYRIVLIDKQPNHFKKVKLFKAIVEEDFSQLFIPFSNYCSDGVEFLQGELKAVHHENQEIEVLDSRGQSILLNYDLMVMALGSVINKVDPSKGGTTLSTLQNAREIREHLLNEASNKSKLRITIIGAGITGIETSAEIATWLKGITASNVEILLLNQHERLLCDIPEKVSKKLESRLNRLGVTTVHNITAHKYENNRIQYNDGLEMESDYCIWTVGVQPNPCLLELDLPMTDRGKLQIDSRYRVKDCKNIYAIGDCAHIVDSKTGEVAGMTCKEAVAEATTLAKIMKADVNGHEVDGHQAYPNLYCIGLGPTDGFFWTQKWGIDFILSGKLGVKLRDYTWNIASLVH